VAAVTGAGQAEAAMWTALDAPGGYAGKSVKCNFAVHKDLLPLTPEWAAAGAAEWKRRLLHRPTRIETIIDGDVVGLIASCEMPAA
jgi:hypothetical protein